MSTSVMIRGTTKKGMQTVVQLFENAQLYETRIVDKGTFFQFYPSEGRMIKSFEEVKPKKEKK